MASLFVHLVVQQSLKRTVLNRPKAGYKFAVDSKGAPVLDKARPVKAIATATGEVVFDMSDSDDNYSE